MTAILGAGIAGLSAAYYALENPRLGPLVVLEASNRVGGWIRSKQLTDETIVETGPHTVRVLGGGQNTLQLLEQLDLSNEIIPATFRSPGVRNKYIYANNKLHTVPNGLTAMLRKNELLGESPLKIVLRELMTPKTSVNDESAHSFAKRRLGERVADYFISPLHCGICGGDAREISVKLACNVMFENEQEYGSIFKGWLYKAFNTKSKKKGSIENDLQEVNKETSTLVTKAKKEMWVVWTLKGGLVQLPLALERNLSSRGVRIEKEHKCEKLRFKPDCVEVVVNGEAREYSRVISSLPSKNLADLVQEQHPQLSAELRSIPTVTIAVVNIQFPRGVLDQNAFGFLVPPKEGLPILGVIFDSCITPQDSTVLTVMMGGAWYERYFGKCPTEEELLNVAINQVQHILQIDADPLAYNVSILNDCIPQYIVGHTERIDRIWNYISTHRIPLELCGSSYRGVGVNDAILRI